LIRDDGRGGRNQELVVSAAAALADFPVEAVAASLATDGVDGASDAAGGMIRGNASSALRVRRTESNDRLRFRCSPSKQGANSTCIPVSNYYN